MPIRPENHAYHDDENRTVDQSRAEQTHPRSPVPGRALRPLLVEEYKETVPAWTLWGIHREKRGKGRIVAPQCVEDPSLVTCRYCLQLMRPSGVPQRHISVRAVALTKGR